MIQVESIMPDTAEVFAEIEAAAERAAQRRAAVIGEASAGLMTPTADNIEAIRRVQLDALIGDLREEIADVFRAHALTLKTKAGN